MNKEVTDNFTGDRFMCFLFFLVFNTAWLSNTIYQSTLAVVNYHVNIRDFN